MSIEICSRYCTRTHYNLDSKGWEKGWSYSFAYYLRELRDVYLALKSWNREFSIKPFYEYCEQISLPAEGAEWKPRRLLEDVNALINFDLVSQDGYARNGFFESAKIGTTLTSEDSEVFRKVYFSYLRFKEIFSWFLDPPLQNRYEFIQQINEPTLLHESRVLFSFATKTVNKKGSVRNDTDSFFYTLTKSPLVYTIDDDVLKRFWSVFCTWGDKLNVLERFNLRNLSLNITPEKTSITCTYIVDPRSTHFDLLDFIRKRDLSKYVYIPALVVELALKYRMRVKDIHANIIEQYKQNKEYLSFERTSEIFVKSGKIKEDEVILFPKYRDSYVSHIILR